MTAHEDWIWRAAVLRRQAAEFRRRSSALIVEAINLEDLADTAEKKAVDGALTNLEDAVSRQPLTSTMGTKS